MKTNQKAPALHALVRDTAAALGSVAERVAQYCEEVIASPNKAAEVDALADYIDPDRKADNVRDYLVSYLCMARAIIDNGQARPTGRKGAVGFRAWYDSLPVKKATGRKVKDKAAKAPRVEASAFEKAKAAIDVLSVAELTEIALYIEERRAGLAPRAVPTVKAAK